MSANNPRFKIETEKETDGRWIAEVIGMAGVLAYGKTRADAITHAQSLALRVIADQIKHTGLTPEDL